MIKAAEFLGRETLRYPAKQAAGRRYKPGILSEDSVSFGSPLCMKMREALWSAAA
jgi:hypothetical protein